ncbi:Peptidase S24/S26A/S26B/S26C family protein, putative isoform 2 [Theobroma cacao]|uniref:signal peptidase I n=1 Tax=Theobroma cacao TaxID=3641 RepID=A0A061GV79_THECC|nr:Peptidase S24/S26A/S26B/S26C family protein, putative isoform 2 [Theobroma cacao]
MVWKGLICITGSESPVVVVLTGSMEPGFKRGDILFLYMSKDPIRAGEIVVFNDGRKVPIVHRVIEVHERRDTREADILTKGDANDMDDRVLYTSSQHWLQQKYIKGRAVGFLPYVGYVTIIMTEKPVIKVWNCWNFKVFMLIKWSFSFFLLNFFKLSVVALIILYCLQWCKQLTKRQGFCRLSIC